MVTLGVIAFVIVVLVAATSATQAPRRRSRQSFENADALILRAESAMLRGKYDEAYGLYQQTLAPARASGCGLFEAEAHYGMARIHQKQGDLPAARIALENALANRQNWAGEKPNFAALIERELANVNSQLPR